MKVEGLEEEVEEVISSEGSDEDDSEKVAGLVKNFTLSEEPPVKPKARRLSFQVATGMVKNMVKEKDRGV